MDFSFAFLFLIFMPIFTSTTLYIKTKDFVQECITTMPTHLRRVTPAKFIKRCLRIQDRNTLPLITYIQCVCAVVAIPRIFILYIVDFLLIISFGPIGIAYGIVIEMATFIILGVLSLPNLFTAIIYDYKLERAHRKIKKERKKDAQKVDVYKKRDTFLACISNNKRQKSFFELADKLETLSVIKNKKKRKYYMTRENAKKAELLVSNEYPYAYVKYRQEDNKDILFVYGQYRNNDIYIIFKAEMN